MECESSGSDDKSSGKSVESSDEVRETRNLDSFPGMKKVKREAHRARKDNAKRSRTCSLSQKNSTASPFPIGQNRRPPK